MKQKSSNKKSFFLPLLILSLFIVIPFASAADIQSTILNQTWKIFLAILALAALYFAIKHFIEQTLYEGTVISPIKNIFLFIIWITIFLILFLVFSSYFMGSIYPSP